MKNVLTKALFAFSTVALAMMVTALFLQVLARETNMAVDWTEELARFSFITMVFIAAAYGTLNRAHLSVSVFSDLIGIWIGERIVHLFHTAVLLVFSAVMVVFSWLNFVDGLQYPNISPAIGFNQNYLFLAMCGGFAIIFLLHLRDFWILLRGGSLDE
jgi:TRAP-type C4-dicarboxylate transport system permease small subunit